MTPAILGSTDTVFTRAIIGLSSHAKIVGGNRLKAVTDAVHNGGENPSWMQHVRYFIYKCYDNVLEKRQSWSRRLQYIRHQHAASHLNPIPSELLLDTQNLRERSSTFLEVGQNLTPPQVHLKIKRIVFKEPRHKFLHLGKFSLTFSWKFVVCNPCQSCPSLTTLVSLLTSY